jgi:hypothetical protein
MGMLHDGILLEAPNALILSAIPLNEFRKSHESLW